MSIKNLTYVALLTLLGWTLGCSNEVHPTLSQVPGPIDRQDDASDDARDTTTRDTTEPDTTTPDTTEPDTTTPDTTTPDTTTHDTTEPDTSEPECVHDSDCDDVATGDCHVAVCSDEGRCELIPSSECACEPQTLWQRAFSWGEDGDVSGLEGSYSLDHGWRIDGRQAHAEGRSLRFGSLLNSAGSTSQSVSGVASGPEIDFPTGAGSFHLRFWVYLEVRENVNVDKLAVVLVGADDERSSVLWQRSENGGLEQEEWHQVEMRLSDALAGTRRHLEFRFDSVNKWNSNVRGVAFDDIKLFTRCP